MKRRAGSGTERLAAGQAGPGCVCGPLCRRCRGDGSSCGGLGCGPGQAAGRVCQHRAHGPGPSPPGAGRRIQGRSPREATRTAVDTPSDCASRLRAPGLHSTPLGVDSDCSPHSFGHLGSPAHPWTRRVIAVLTAPDTRSSTAHPWTHRVIVPSLLQAPRAHSTPMDTPSDFSPHGSGHPGLPARAPLGAGAAPHGSLRAALPGRLFLSQIYGRRFACRG